MGLLVLGWAMTAQADDLADKGRAIFNQYQQAVVSLQTLVRAKVLVSGTPAQTNESHHTISGTVVTPAGLTAVSLAALDPTEALKNMAGKDPRVKVEAELSEIKMRLADGSEVEAEVAGRAPELDLAFVRPKTKPAAALKAVDLSQAGKAGVLEPVIALNRLGSAAEHAFSASVERIAAVVEQPRPFYVPDANMTTASLGAPAFTLEGKVVGMFLIRNAPSKSQGGMLDTPGESLTGIILPAAEILKAEQQVVK